ncbi:MAG: DUF1636 domain-containing protein [Pelagimonas sp.]|jgi:predicted metal-binding protein|nr:DUF1636 domain-containing protein [Pelagimonas sp.]
MADQPTELMICVKCRRGQDLADDDRRPGQRLFDDLAQRDLPDGMTVKAVECLSNCSNGCSIALRGGDRWTYLYGNVDETSHSDEVLEGAAKYHNTTDGLVPWRERSELFKRNCIGRVPPLSI